MKQFYFTLTGTKHYFGSEFLEQGTKLFLEKEPDNKYDKIGDTAQAKVVLATSNTVLCKISKKSIIGEKEKELIEK